MVQDPVCGTQVDEEQAETHGLVYYNGEEALYFCSESCKLLFDQEPGAYVLQPDAEGL